MNMSQATSSQARLIGALSNEDSSIRLKAALAAGSDPDPVFLDELVERCAVESDFFVREMLSWALTRLPSDLVLDRLHQELHSESNQARSQALHTLSKINDKTAWSWITTDMLRDSDDEVARTAWRVASLLAPEEKRKSLGDELILQLGRGDRSLQLSLSRALIGLGDVIKPSLGKALRHPDPDVAAHARATELLMNDPEAGFAIEDAKRAIILDRLEP